MSNVERGILGKLQASVTFLPGSSHKRFILGLREHSQLSAKGRNYLAYIANRYRRQWKASGDELDWIDRWNAYKRAAMTEHYTRNTETATAWCNRCQRFTTHRVDGGRKGPCLEHETPIREKKPARAADSQKGLFEE